MRSLISPTRAAWVSLLLAPVFPMPAEAAWQMPVTNFTRQEYAAGTQNWDMAQQQNDWIYVGNNYGLLEYDGTRWKLYGLWNSSAVRSVKVAENGEIFCGGTNEFGVFRSDGLGGLTYEPLSVHLPEADSGFGDVWGIEVWRNNVYFVTHNAIFTLDRVTRRVSKHDSRQTISSCALVGDTLYVSRADGIFSTSSDGSVVARLRGSEKVTALGVRKICAMSGGRLLIGTTKGGLWVAGGGRLSKMRTEADDYVSRNVLYTVCANDSYIAQGTVAGGVALTRLDGSEARYVNGINGLQNNTVLSAMFDKAGNLWCGLDQGVDRIEIDSPQSQLYGQASDFGSGYASIISAGKLFIGTNRGLFRTNYPLDDSAPTFSAECVGGSIGQVWSLGLVGNQVVCCHDKGLFAVGAEGGLRPISEADGFWQVRTFPLNESLGVAGGYDGLYIIRHTPAGIVMERKLEGAPRQAKTFEVDSNNRIWICTDNGVERLTINQDMTRCVREVVMKKPDGESPYCNVIKLDGHIVVSAGENSYVTNERNELSDEPGILELCDGNKAFYNIIRRDSDGNVWYITGNALKVRRLDKRSMQYDTRPALLWDLPGFYVYGFTSMLTIGHGQAIVSCVQGFALADMRNAAVRVKERSPKLFIRQLASITPGNEGVFFGASYPPVEREISIPYAQNSVRVTFSCTQGYAKAQSFSCMLSRDGDGDGEYTDWDAASAKEYTFLKPGRYRFRVKMRHTDGAVFGPVGISFVILPPWYLTWWAWSAYAILALASAAIIVAAVKRHNKATRRRLALQKEEELKRQEQDFAQKTLLRDKEILQLRNEKMESELKSKSQELSSFMLNTLNRNELITKVKRDVCKIQEDLDAQDKASAQKRLAQLQAKLTQDADTRVNWDRFEENFDIVNDKFMRKLQAKFPWISSNEKKLCVYIVMGYMNKEIAPLMNISTRGVEMLRYRMRKKMELQREDDIESLLRSIRDENDSSAD